MTTTTNHTRLVHYHPCEWRVINRLYSPGRVIGGGATGYRVPGARTHDGKASVTNQDARRIIERQDCPLDYLIRLECDGLIRASLGQGSEAVPVGLYSLNGKLPTGRGHGARVVIELTAKGREVARDPLNMVLVSIGRKHRYRVEDVTRSAGVAGPDVKSVLVALEDLLLIECRNDTGTVPLTMWSKAINIPPFLRLSLTRRGGTYLARK
jgi:hypothetical protein